MKKTFIIAINILILVGCQSKIKNELTTESPSVQLNEIRKETKVFGDSLKIVYEYRGDTVIQERIDLKKISEDNFDDSFTVVSVFSRKEKSNLSCTEIFKMTIDSMDFQYCYDDIFSKLEADLLTAKNADKPSKVEGLNETKRKIIDYKNGTKTDLKWIKRHFVFDLILDLDFDIYDNKNRSEIESIIIEKYETNFSGGHQYYFLNKERDTIVTYNIRDWII
ncbi:hypothetical protein [Dokdonia sp. PRO95]|uniref:hypothetical protein n=1 Tax=Dokdonia sp. PRO95 TaxID=1239415 RepID=UPI0012602FEF|nr:hypothetical protein [Dokdonia sp. PRO95]